VTRAPKKTIRARLLPAARVVVVAIGVCLVLEFLPFDLALVVVTFALTQLGVLVHRLRLRARPVKARPASPP
jgi:hypothetical protein